MSSKQTNMSESGDRAGSSIEDTSTSLFSAPSESPRPIWEEDNAFSLEYIAFKIRSAYKCCLCEFNKPEMEKCTKCDLLLCTSCSKIHNDTYHNDQTDANLQLLLANFAISQPFEAVKCNKCGDSNSILEKCNQCNVLLCSICARPHYQYNCYSDPNVVVSQQFNANLDQSGSIEIVRCNRCAKNDAKVDKCNQCNILICANCITSHQQYNCARTSNPFMDIINANLDRTVSVEFATCTQCGNNQSKVVKCNHCFMVLCSPCSRPHHQYYCYKDLNVEPPQLRYANYSPSGVRNMSPEPNHCGKCGDNRSKIDKCFKCNMQLCSNCSIPHHRSNCYRNSNNGSFDRPNANFAQSRNQRAINSRPHNNNYFWRPRGFINPQMYYTFSKKQCNIHQKIHTLYCEKCITSYCEICYQITPACSHPVIFIDEALPKAQEMSIGMEREIETIMVSLRESMNNADIVHKSNDITFNLFRDTIIENLKCLQIRSENLLKYLMREKAKKEFNLNSYRYGIDQIGNRLAVSSILLKRSMSPNSICDPVLAHLNACCDIDFFRNNGSALLSLDAVDAFLTPPEDDILTTPFPPNRRFQRRNGNQVAQVPIYHYPKILLPEEHPDNNNHRNQAIHGTTRPVRVKLPDERSNSFSIGKYGKENGQFFRPWGVCCNHEGKIIVADRSNDRIQIFSPDGSFLRSFGKNGSQKGELNRPAGITINRLGQIAVVDKDNHRVQVFTMEGEFVLQFGGFGTDEGKLNYPWDIDSNSKGHYIITDSRNHRVQLFMEDGSFLSAYSIRLWTKETKQMTDVPRGVSFTPNGDFVVTEFSDHKVIKIGINSPRISYASFGVEGVQKRYFRRPQGIIVDDDGNMIISDSKNDRIQILDSRGRFLRAITRPGFRQRFRTPVGICLNPEGRIVVVDLEAHRVVVL